MSPIVQRLATIIVIDKQKKATLFGWPLDLFFTIYIIQKKNILNYLQV